MAGLLLFTVMSVLVSPSWSNSVFKLELTTPPSRYSIVSKAATLRCQLENDSASNQGLLELLEISISKKSANNSWETVEMLSRGSGGPVIAPTIRWAMLDGAISEAWKNAFLQLHWDRIVEESLGEYRCKVFFLKRDLSSFEETTSAVEIKREKFNSSEAAGTIGQEIIHNRGRLNQIEWNVSKMWRGLASASNQSDLVVTEMSGLLKAFNDLRNITEVHTEEQKNQSGVIEKVVIAAESLQKDVAKIANLSRVTEERIPYLEQSLASLEQKIDHYLATEDSDRLAISHLNEPLRKIATIDAGILARLATLENS